MASGDDQYQTLRKAILRLARAEPKFRKHLVPLVRRTASGCIRVTGGKRGEYEDIVWDMFVRSYSKIGLTLSSPSQMYNYAVWELCQAQGEFVAFNVFKSTSYGLKSGLSGSNGSSEGKRAVVNGIRTKFKQPGHYGEVSHKVEGIALAAGAPVVCAAHVGAILGKNVKVLDDGIHYTRQLKGVGNVTKVLVGNPRGIPTTRASDPSCPVSLAAADYEVTEDDHLDLAAHFACVAMAE